MAFDNTVKRLAVYLFVAGVPFLVGCSTLGIAKVEDLETLEANAQRQTTATTQRLTNIEGQLQQLVDQEAQRQSRLDSLSADISRLHSLLATLNIETLASDAQRASELAESAETRGRTLLQHYHQRLIQEQQLLMQEIQFLEQLMQGPPTQADTTAAAPPAGGAQN